MIAYFAVSRGEFILTMYQIIRFSAFSVYFVHNWRFVRACYHKKAFDFVAKYLCAISLFLYKKARSAISVNLAFSAFCLLNNIPRGNDGERLFCRKAVLGHNNRINTMRASFNRFGKSAPCIVYKLITTHDFKCM
jgi:hypothetical protein